MTHSSPIDTEFSKVLSGLPAGFDLDVSAKQSGALIRRRAVRSGQNLLRLAFGYSVGGMSLRGASAWAQLMGIAKISDVSLLDRLRGAAGWLGDISAAILSERVSKAEGGAGMRRVRLVDATTLSCPGSRKTDWRVHVSYRLGPAPRIEQIELSDGRGAESLKRFPCDRGDIGIGDSVYAKAMDLADVTAQGGDFIVRTGWNAMRWRTPDGARFDLFSMLETVPEGGEAEVNLAIACDRAGNELLPVRLVVRGKSAEQAARARQRARRNSCRQGKTPKKETLKAAGYILLVTSLDGDSVATGEVLDLYRLRWQIELVFKRFKSLLHLDQLPAKDPDLARCWIYTKLIAALLLEDMTGHFLDSPPWGEPIPATQHLNVAHPAPAA